MVIGDVIQSATGEAYRSRNTSPIGRGGRKVDFTGRSGMLDGGKIREFSSQSFYLLIEVRVSHQLIMSGMAGAGCCRFEKEEKGVIW